MMSGAQYIGSLKLSDEQQNYIFKNDKEVFMVIWCKSSRGREKIPLEKESKIIDIYGNPLKGIYSEETQILNITDLPIIIKALKEELIEKLR
jgi:hypothetical protein